MALSANQMYQNALTPVMGWFDESALDKRAPLHPLLFASTTTVPAGRVACLDSDGMFVLLGYVTTAGYTYTNGSVATAGTAATGGALPLGQMPVFLWNGSKDYDVGNVGVPTGGAYGVAGSAYWYGINPGVVLSGASAGGASTNGASVAGASTYNWTTSGGTTGYMSGLVATGGYELQTTEFDSNASVGVYRANDFLTVTVSTDPAYAGMLTRRNSASCTPAATPDRSGTGVKAYLDYIVGIASSHVNYRFESVGTGPSAAQIANPESSPVGYNANSVKTLTFWSYFLPALGAVNPV